MSDFAKFYYLSLGFQRGALHTEVIGLPADSHDEGRLVDRVTRGEQRLPPGAHFCRVSGGRQVDLVGTTWGNPYLVSARLAAILRDNDVSGYFLTPVVVEDRGNRVDGYELLSIVGRCGSLDPSLREPVILPPKSPRGQAIPGWRGLFFPIESWDGSDFFLPHENSRLLVTKRVYDLVAAHKISNVHMTRLDQFEMPM